MDIPTKLSFILTVIGYGFSHQYLDFITISAVYVSNDYVLALDI